MYKIRCENGRLFISIIRLTMTILTVTIKMSYLSLACIIQMVPISRKQYILTHY